MSLPQFPVAVGVNGGAFNVTTTGYLANAITEQPHVDFPCEKSEPAFAGKMSELVEKHKDNAGFLRQVRNKVKKCTSCGKPNAFTLLNCNACGASLPTEISYTNNIFSGFIYGVQKGPFPFTISLRHQDADFIVFDDLLALTPCHLNVIPTSKYIPDWRFLLKNPKEGKAILLRMYELCFKVVKEQFWPNKAWRAKFVNNPKITDVEQLRPYIATGMNYPPSQYQLHLQFMLLPLLPFQHLQYLNGVHFTPGRFFPMQYIIKVLDAATDLDSPYPVKDDTPVQEIMAFFKAKGVDYDVMHEQLYAEYGQRHTELACWDVKDFEGVVVNNMYYKVVDGKYVPQPDVKASDIPAKDKKHLQNYGRPYNKESGRPTGTYYKMAKKPGDVPGW